jgi:hypothetical protein
MMTHMPPTPRVPRPLTEEEQAKVDERKAKEVAQAIRMAQSLVTPTKERKAKKAKKAVVNNYRDRNTSGTVTSFSKGLKEGAPNPQGLNTVNTRGRASFVTKKTPKGKK